MKQIILSIFALGIGHIMAADAPAKAPTCKIIFKNASQIGDDVLKLEWEVKNLNIGIDKYLGERKEYLEVKPVVEIENIKTKKKTKIDSYQINGSGLIVYQEMTKFDVSINDLKKGKYKILIKLVDSGEKMVADYSMTFTIK
jgi:hypothetical protein